MFFRSRVLRLPSKPIFLCRHVKPRPTAAHCPKKYRRGLVLTVYFAGHYKASAALPLCGPAVGGRMLSFSHRLFATTDAKNSSRGFEFYSSDAGFLALPLRNRLHRFPYVERGYAQGAIRDNPRAADSPHPLGCYNYWQSATTGHGRTASFGRTIRQGQQQAAFATLRFGQAVEGKMLNASHSPPRVVPVSTPHIPPRRLRVFTPKTRIT